MHHGDSRLYFFGITGGNGFGDIFMSSSCSVYGDASLGGRDPKHATILIALGLSLFLHGVVLLLPGVRGDDGQDAKNSVGGEIIHILLVRPSQAVAAATEVEVPLMATAQPPSSSDFAATDNDAKQRASVRVSPVEAAGVGPANALPGQRETAEPSRSESMPAKNAGTLSPERLDERPQQRSRGEAEYLYKGLDRPPRSLAEIHVDYPDAAVGREGRVVLKVLINEAGLVDDVRVLSANPPGVFNDDATRAFRAARFSPGLLGGVPTKSQLTVAVDFSPLNRGESVSDSGY